MPMGFDGAAGGGTQGSNSQRLPTFRRSLTTYENSIPERVWLVTSSLLEISTSSMFTIPRANGERKHAFGRVFFVEGKSLVFYAYDLPGPKRANKKVEFQVWGEQAGLSSVIVNLGAMHSDNSGQSRWVLTCDDPKVLSRINAVFITADANARPDSQPRGSKMMYAFLGSPNHP
jgi:hypothetical protein